jgi:hypothetical protein
MTKPNKQDDLSDLLNLSANSLSESLFDLITKHISELPVKIQAITGILAAQLVLVNLYKTCSNSQEELNEIISSTEKNLYDIVKHMKKPSTLN